MMKDVFLVYNTSCFYEIVILNYFMSFTKCEVIMLIGWKSNMHCRRIFC